MAQQCAFHVHKCEDVVNVNGVCDPGEEAKDWKIIATPSDPLCSTLNEITVLPDGAAHFELGTCIGATYTLTEDITTGPATPPNTHWECVSPAGCSMVTGTCVNGQEIPGDYVFVNQIVQNPTTVPEFPTLAVSAATLVALGFVVYTVKQRKQ
jgi:hypothetical protein